jgi:DNA replication and repair protein RecF
LQSAREEEARLRQTTTGPHRDDVELLLEGNTAQQFASEGQQRTIALALKVAQARSFLGEASVAPLLLVDDVFGELDAPRRNRVLAALPAESQKLVTATTLTWMENRPAGHLWHITDRRLLGI